MGGVIRFFLQFAILARDDNWTMVDIIIFTRHSVSISVGRLVAPWSLWLFDTELSQTFTVLNDLGG